jgi:O-acetyl-ADP-ribose deacetylase (regulator of RNase III)
MITILTGNILESESECLVNTVNCEGYMGKGIAYQFKKAFPKNNEDYIRACKTGELRIGKIHSFKEKNKIIINFPTKDKWREKSKIEYIENGMDELLKFVDEQKINSIAIPPLGCGNGGLKWDEVHNLIVSKIEKINKNFILYAPTLSVSNGQISKAPKLNLSHLILMKYKMALKKFGKIRLQKTAYFMNLFMDKEYFYFKPQIYGPYAHSIEILSKDILEYQEYHKKNTQEAFEHAFNVLVSEKVKTELKVLDKVINKASDLVNSFSNTTHLELAATICYIIQHNAIENENEMIQKIHSWSQRKKMIYDNDSILDTLKYLEVKGFIKRDLLNYSLSFK